MRFIHASDWHIGNYFYNFSKVENEDLSKGRFKTLESIFRYADKQKISLMLVAGDQFDSNEIDLSEVREVFNIIKSYPQIRVVMITGNHDPMSANSIYDRIGSDSVPSNLTLVKDNEIIYLEDIFCKIFASSLKDKNGKENPVEWIDEKNEEHFFRIALCHGSAKIEGKYAENDFPIPLDIASIKNLDYVAAGHFHSFLKINDRFFYSGSPEQLQFKDEGFALDVFLEKGESPIVNKIENLNYFNWSEIDYEVSDNCWEKVKNEIEKYFNYKNVVNLNLKGYLSLEAFQKFNEFINSISKSFFKIFINNEVKLKPDVKEIENVVEEGYIKEVLKKLFKIKDTGKTPENINVGEDIISEVADEAIINIYNFYKEK